MSVRIRVSYEHPQELEQILEKLAPDVVRWKVAGWQEGHFKKAYVEMGEMLARMPKE